MPMYTTPTVELSVDQLDEDGNVQGGLRFYWTEGAHVVLVQAWEYSCSGNIYGPVNPDPMAQDNLLDYFLECWQDRAGIHYRTNDVKQFS